MLQQDVAFLVEVHYNVGVVTGCDVLNRLPLTGTSFDVATGRCVFSRRFTTCYSPFIMNK
ncbi:hypothetical protein [Terrilactibacillus laevilacticus]|uniref:hypothetical protein n=1 Tax=Terrilactibacillus laevilacticus TaxID=1380157 RepID=UPI0011403306|nr:hypothetical protein [Terrilactibacillus laevilacticus]